MIPANPLSCHGFPWLGQCMQFGQLKRREFITLLGGSAAWPLTAHGQQAAIPVDWLSQQLSADLNPKLTQAFRQGLNDTRFFDGQDVSTEYRWDEEGRYDRLPIMAASSG